MNKPLVLAMCDVLVLSALSLSTGNFSDGGSGEKDGGGKGTDAKETQPTGGSVTNPPSGGTHKVTSSNTTDVAGIPDLSERLRILQEQLDATNGVLKIVRAERDDATNMVKLGEAKYSDLSNAFVAVSSDAKQKGEDLKLSQDERDRLNALLAELEKELANKDEKLAGKDLDISRLNNTNGVLRAIIRLKNKTISDKNKIIDDQDAAIAVLKPDAEELRRRQKNARRARSSLVQVEVAMKGGKLDKYWSPVVRFNNALYVLGIYSQEELEDGIDGVNIKAKGGDVKAERAQFVHLDKKQNLVMFKLRGLIEVGALCFSPKSYDGGNAKGLILRKGKNKEEAVYEPILPFSKKTNLVGMLDEAWQKLTPINDGDCLVDEEEAYLVRMRVGKTEWVNFYDYDIKLWDGCKKIFQ